jgi:hypothetical protein
VIRAQHHVATIASVATVRRAKRDIRVAEHARAAFSAVAAGREYAYAVHESPARRARRVYCARQEASPHFHKFSLQKFPSMN